MRNCIALATLVASTAIRAAVTIDVMFAYDQSAAGWLSANGVDGSVLAAQTVEKMNSVLPATHLDEHFSFRLVGVMTSAAETTGGTGDERLVNALQSGANETGVATGAWKDIQTARDTCKADVVVVLVDSGTGGDAAGISWCMDDQVLTNLTLPKFAPWAYSVCSVRSVGGGHVVTHEVAHVMGAGHSDLLVGGRSGPQLYPYSSAYHFTDVGGVKRRTIMGYDHTSYEDSGYELYPAFSSAEFTTPDGDKLGDANHDNTRTLRETCAVVSRFRLSGDEGGGASSSTGGGATSSSAKFSAKVVVPCKVVDSEDRIVGVAQVTVAKTDRNSQSKVSAVLYGFDGKKKSAKAVKAGVTLSDDGATVKDVRLDVKGEAAPFVVSVAEDGAVAGTFGPYSVKRISSLAEPSASPRFRIMGMPDAIDGMTVMNDVESNGKAYHLLPDGEGVGFSVSGKKWVFAKAANVKYVKNRNTNQMELLVDVGKDGSKTNLCGLKLSVNAKTGVFNGSFAAYVKTDTSGKPKAKKLNFKVSGLLVDGIGFGHASCKGTMVDVAL